MLFVFIVVLACATLFAVGFLVKVGRSEMRGHFTEHLLLGLATVVCPGVFCTPFSGCAMHTLFMAIAINRAKVYMLAGSSFRESGNRIISILLTRVFVCCRHDLSGVGCTNYFIPDAAAEICRFAAKATKCGVGMPKACRERVGTKIIAASI